jgi:hypothetical protein
MPDFELKTERPAVNPPPIRASRPVTTRSKTIPALFLLTFEPQYADYIDELFIDFGHIA